MLNTVISNDLATKSGSLAGTGSAQEGPIQLLERHAYADAITVLQEVVRDDPSASNHALLGTAYFLAEKYEEAKRHLVIATEKDPQHLDWIDKLTLATANASTRVDEDYPPVLEFDRKELLAAPSVERGALPDVTHTPSRDSLFGAVLGGIETVSGAAVTAVIDGLSRAAGALGVSDAVWTNWYRKPLVLGVMTLAYMRETLNKNNLKDTYPPDVLTAFQSRGLIPPAGVKYFRTADGSWNNLSNPKEGAAGVRFPRNVNLNVTWPETGARLLTPNPSEISRVLLSRGKDGMKEVPFLNLLAAAWIQFNVHDWVSHRVTYKWGVHEVPLSSEHPARKAYYQSHLFIPKTESDPTRTRGEARSPQTSINEVTSWWDASQVYGSDQKTADSLRTMRDGKMKLDAKGHLPIGEGDIEQAGFNRNWWVGLTLMHTIFVSEHNAICDMLKRNNPEWDDARLYNVGRLVNAAVIAKIHTVEWTPAILPNRGLYMAMNANWYGFAEMSLHPAGKRKVRRALKVKNPELGGIVGNSIEKHGSPYGLAEEFTEVYRLHELLPDELVLRSLRDEKDVRTLPLAQTRQVGAHELAEKVGIENLLYSFGNQHPGQIVLNNYPRTLQQLSLPGNPVYDLGAVDILRARERGVPRYNEFRRQFGLKPIRSFEDLTTDPGVVAALKSVYDNDIEAIDLHVGSRAETQRPTFFGFGETLFQVFILNASRRLQADRFFTESYTEEVYTKEGLDWVDDADFKGVLLRHYPTLAETGLANVTNAFEPWDTGDLLPSRHPLRAYL